MIKDRIVFYYTKDCCHKINNQYVFGSRDYLVTIIGFLRYLNCTYSKNEHTKFDVRTDGPTEIIEKLKNVNFNFRGNIAKISNTMIDVIKKKQDKEKVSLLL